MTIIGDLGCNLDLVKLYKHLKLQKNPEKKGIVGKQNKYESEGLVKRRKKQAKVEDQVAFFMSSATPDATTLMALDWEDAPEPDNNLDHNEAKEFMQRLDDALGRKCKFYSGNRAKEQLIKASDADLEFFVDHDLWLCQYGPNAILPKGFKKYWLWQYTGDGTGLPPHNVPGIIAGNKGLDINHFDGTEAELKASWV